MPIRAHDTEVLIRTDEDISNPDQIPARHRAPILRALLTTVDDALYGDDDVLADEALEALLWFRGQYMPEVTGPLDPRVDALRGRATP